MALTAIVIGSMMFGFLLPELCKSLGDGQNSLPVGQNIVCSLSFGLLSFGFMA